MRGVDVFRTGVAPEWIDYNGHLRDAYYSLIFSLATDALMDRIGLDEAYRTRTRCTLYTLEMHTHFLHEVMETDVIDVSIRILGTDQKRIHAALDMRCARYPDVVATAELMLLHVHQGVEPKARVFPQDVVEALRAVAAAGAPSPAAVGLGAAAAAGATIESTAAGGNTGATIGSNTAGANVGATIGGTAAGGATEGLSAGATPVSIPGSRRMELRSRS